MVALRCVALKHDETVADKKICRAFIKDGAFKIVGGIISSHWKKRNSIKEINCNRCSRLGTSLTTLNTFSK